VANYDQQFEQRLEKVWRQLQAQAKKDGYKLWNSKTYALKKLREVSGHLELSIGLIDYKHHVSIMRLIRQGEIGEEYFTRFMYCSALIKTTDNKYVFGIGTGILKDQIKFVGGSYAQDEQQLTNGQSLFNLPVQEMKDEIGVGLKYIDQIVLKRLYLTPNGAVDLTFYIKLNIDSTRVSQLFTDRKEDEFKELVVLKAERANEAVSKMLWHLPEKADLIS